MNINNPLCATGYGNTGYGDCFLEPAKIIGAFQVPSTFEIAEGDVVGLRAFLESKAVAAYGSRIFPLHKFASVTDNTEDVSITTTDYGFKYVNRDGFYDFTFRYFAGGVSLHQEIAKNAGSNKHFLFYDDNGVLYGYKSAGKLKGIPVDIFYVNPWRFATGADAASYQLRFVINPVYMNKGNLGFLKATSFNLFDIAGLQDVDIALVDIAANVATVQVFSRISKVDLHTAYAANLSQVTAWKAVDELGATVAITTVTDNPTDGGWDVTLNLAAFNAADKVYLTLAAPTVLQAAPINVVGFDGKDALIIEAPMS